MSIKKIFFPFAIKYTHLIKHSWHRFAIVAYWIIIIFSLFGVFSSIQTPEINNRANCFSMQIELHPTNALQAMDANCSVFQPDTGFNIIVAIIATLIISYLIQIVYYKIILYVALGKNISQS